MQMLRFFFAYLIAIHIVVSIGFAQDNSKEIFQKLLEKAKRGDKEAQQKVGECYDYGTGIEQNNQEAIKWYTKSALQGNAEVQLNLGRMYENGEGVEQNPSLAMAWYKKSALQGNAEAKGKLEALQLEQKELLSKFLMIQSVIPQYITIKYCIKQDAYGNEYIDKTCVDKVTVTLFNQGNKKIKGVTMVIQFIVPNQKLILYRKRHNVSIILEPGEALETEVIELEKFIYYDFGFYSAASKKKNHKLAAVFNAQVADVEFEE